MGAYLRTVWQFQSNRKYLKNLKGLLFLDETVKTYFENHIIVKYDWELLVIPTIQLYLKKWKTRPLEKEMTIIIPGEMSALRRSYNMLSPLIENSTLRLNLIFLGKGDIKTLDKFKHKKSDRVKIVSYEDHLPVKMYYRILLRGDLIILPLNYNKYYGGIKETLGESTFSASYMDVLSSGIPALVPERMTFHKEFNTFVNEYTDADSLHEQVVKYFSKDYEKLKNQFIKASHKKFNRILLRNLQSLQ